jgi:hypothetical protein
MWRGAASGRRPSSSRSLKPNMAYLVNVTLWEEHVRVCAGGAVRVSLRLGGFGLFVEEVLDEVGAELEELAAYGSEEGDAGAVLQGEADAALVGGVVGVGDGSGDEVAEDVGGVELVLAVVSAADDGGESGVDETRLDAAGALAKVAGILMEDGGEQGVADDGTVDVVGVGGADALEVPGWTPAVAVVGVGDFAVAAGEEGFADVEGVDGALEGEMPLLAGGEGKGLSVFDDVELRDDAEEALLLFGLELVGGGLWFLICGLLRGAGGGRGCRRGPLLLLAEEGGCVGERVREVVVRDEGEGCGAGLRTGQGWEEEGQGRCERELESAMQSGGDLSVSARRWE